MRSLFTRGFGESIAEAGLGLAGGAAFFLLVTPTGRRLLQAGASGAAKGATMTCVAIGSLVTDLRMGWTELIQEIRMTQSGHQPITAEPSNGPTQADLLNPSGIQ